MALFDRVVAGEMDDYRTEKRFIRKDGAVVDVDLSVHCHRRDDGSVQYLLKLLSDVTARRRAEAEIQRLNLELDEALASTSDLLDRVTAAAKVGGWELDVRDRCDVLDGETYRIHEVDSGAESSLAQTLAFYGPDVRRGIEAMIQAGITDGTPWEYELPMTAAKGRAAWIRGQGFATREEGEIVALRGTFQDVTAQREAAAREERTRLARDLHDSITQALFAAALKAEALTQDEDIPAGSADTAEQVRRLTRARPRGDARAAARAALPVARGGADRASSCATSPRPTEGRADIVVAVTLRGEGLAAAGAAHGDLPRDAGGAEQRRAPLRRDAAPRCSW